MSVQNSTAIEDTTERDPDGAWYAADADDYGRCGTAESRSRQWVYISSVENAAPRSGFTGLVAAVNSRALKPWATLTTWICTAAAGSVQLLHPVLLHQFGRDPAGLAAGQWWRMVTPMFVQDGGLLGLVFNLVALAVIGTLAETLLGPRRWLMVYFFAGLFGNAVSSMWLNPTGAGNSMAVAGLLGVLAVAILGARRRYGVYLSVRLRAVAGTLPVLAIVDTAQHDNHGLPFLLGMVLGLLMLPRRQSTTANRFGRPTSFQGCGYRRFAAGRICGPGDGGPPL